MRSPDSPKKRKKLLAITNKANEMQREITQAESFKQTAAYIDDMISREEVVKMIKAYQGATNEADKIVDDLLAEIKKMKWKKKS